MGCLKISRYLKTVPPSFDSINILLCAFTLSV